MNRHVAGGVLIAFAAGMFPGRDRGSPVLWKTDTGHFKRALRQWLLFKNRSNFVGIYMEPVKDAVYYRLYVKAESAQYQAIDETLTDTNFVYQTYGYIVNRNRFDWKWKVSAFVDNVWSGWSEEATFTVEPVDTDCKS